VPYRTDAPSPLAASKQTGRRPPHAAAKKKTPKRRIRDGRTHQQPRPGGHQLVGLPQQFCREFVSRGRVSKPAHRRVWSGRRSQPSARTTSPVTTPPERKLRDGPRRPGVHPLDIRGEDPSIDRDPRREQGVLFIGGWPASPSPARHRSAGRRSPIRDRAQIVATQSPRISEGVMSNQRSRFLCILRMRHSSRDNVIREKPGW
jgi:hypothetical protein